MAEVSVPSKTPRKIIHIDMDAFFAAIEQRDNPKLHGRPVAVGSPTGRGVVCAASYEARRFGVHSALPSSIARRRCPELIFVSPRFEVYRDVSRQIREIFHAYTDLVEPLSLDEAFLDVTINRPAITSATKIARDIKREIKERTSLTASAGVSINKFLAKVASDYRKPDGITVIPPELAEEFSGRLLIEKIPGIGEVTVKKLHALGIRTGKELAEVAREELARRFGKFGLLYYRLARGIDESPVRPNRPRKSMGTEITFEQDLERLEDMKKQLKNLSRELANRLAGKGLLGATVTLKIKYHDFKQTTRSRTLSVPIGGERDILKVAKDLLISPPPVKPIRLLGITLSSLAGPGRGGIQLTFLDSLKSD